MTKQDAVEYLKALWKQAGDVVTLDDTQGLFRWVELRSKQERKTLEVVAR